jgi:hypothetical protein
VETFYSDRWYNVFEIYDRDDGKFKGWYCNIGYPAVIEKDTVSYIDLALDLWVSAEGGRRRCSMRMNSWDAGGCDHPRAGSFRAGRAETEICQQKTSGITPEADFIGLILIDKRCPSR